MIFQITVNYVKGGCQKWRVGVFNGAEIVECQMELTLCPWAMPLGHGRLCNHPSAKQFVNSKPSYLIPAAIITSTQRRETQS
jgi:hypothetical protein